MKNKKAAFSMILTSLLMSDRCRLTNRKEPPPSYVLKRAVNKFSESHGSKECENVTEKTGFFPAVSKTRRTKAQQAGRYNYGLSG